MVFKEQSRRRRDVIWRQDRDELPVGDGMNITKMTIWWARQRGRWVRFYIKGVLELPDDIGVNTTPAEATVTLQIPLSDGDDNGSLNGEDTAAFRVLIKLNRWLTYRRS